MSEDDSANKLKELLRLLKVNDGDLSKLTTQQRKEMNEYKFWKTQPVTKFDEVIKKEGPIDASKRPEDVSDTPLPLLPEFECGIFIFDVIFVQ